MFCNSLERKRACHVTEMPVFGRLSQVFYRKYQSMYLEKDPTKCQPKVFRPIEVQKKNQGSLEKINYIRELIIYIKIYITKSPIINRSFCHHVAAHQQKRRTLLGSRSYFEVLLTESPVETRIGKNSNQQKVDQLKLDCTHFRMYSFDKNGKQ